MTRNYKTAAFAPPILALAVGAHAWGQTKTTGTVDISKQATTFTEVARLYPDGSITTKYFSLQLPHDDKQGLGLDWPKSLTAEGSWTFKIDGKEYKLTGQQLAGLITGGSRIVQHSIGPCSANIANVKGDVIVSGCECGAVIGYAAGGVLIRSGCKDESVAK